MYLLKRVLHKLPSNISNMKLFSSRSKPILFTIIRYRMNQSEVNGGDVYVWTLSDELKQIAYDELHEDDNIRTQALAQFREWIVKHPKIKHCRTDSLFLLRFLRTRKFNISRACEMLERYLTMYELYPKWFYNLDIMDDCIQHVIRMGYFVPLPKRDKFGRQVAWICFKNFDTKQYTATEFIKIFCLMTEYLTDIEESQINGYVYVYHDQYPLDFVTMFTLSDVKVILNCFQHAMPMRHKEFHFLNVPSYAQILIDFMLNTFSTKLKKRVVMHTSYDDFKNKVDVSLLPKEHGGTIPMAEIIENVLVDMKLKRDRILLSGSSKIDVYDLPVEENSEMVGSFRKLEVD